MKIRLDFVTNSSSSSFVTFNIKNKELAKVCSRFWIPVDNDGERIGGLWSAEEGCSVVGVPGMNGIAEWFEKLLDPWENQVYQLEDSDYSDAIDYVRKHRNEINAANEFSEIDSAYVVSDGGISSISIERREKGVITEYEVEEWEYREMGVALWQLLEGYSRNEYYQTVVDYAEEHGGVLKRADPWYTEVSENKIYDTCKGPVSIAGKKCCLTGNFCYGSRRKVGEYIAAKGGTVSSSVTRDTNILVVGALGNEAWSHNRYGSKVVEAMENREKGCDITIIREEDLFSGDEKAEEIQRVVKEKLEKTNKEKERKEKERFFRQVDRYNSSSEEAWRGDHKAKWLKKYGYLIDELEFIDLNAKSVVVSGGNPVYRILESLGATVRYKSVSGKTDYLFVDPSQSGYSKIEKVKELRQAGNTRVKVVSAENLTKLLQSGQYYSTEMALEDEKRVTEELKKRVDTSLKNNTLGYGLLLTMMTCLKAIPVNAIDPKERLALESLLISDKMESILGTNLKEVLQYYQADSTAMALQCMKYIKENADLAEVQAMIDRIRDEFGEDNTILITFLDIVASMIKEA